MQVRAKKIAPAHKQPGGQPTPKPAARQFLFPAPTNGWTLNENLTTPSPQGARVLDNWICGPTSIRARGGFNKTATVASGAAVTSLFAYRSGSTGKMFAATASAVYDVTAPADPDVIPAAAFSGQTAGYYSTAQYGTAGGNYLYAVNGADNPRLFDGATWTAIDGASTPAITGVTTTTLSHVWSFASRIWFVQKDTMTAWYLPADSIGGAAQSVSLAGIFRKGGALLFGAAWSLDAGDGLDDKCVFVSTEGEVAVYEGSDPSTASTWRKVGVYEISAPLGQNATMQAGGDLLIATDVGLVPISEAIKRDIAALSVGAVTRRIEPYWQDRARTQSSLPWEIAKWPTEGIMIVTQPQSTANIGTMLVANLQTGAWSRFTGMDARCVTHFDGYVYFGSSSGGVYRMQETGADDGMPYTCVYLGQHEGLGMPVMQKTVGQMRPVFITNSPIAPQLTALVNYSEELSSAPSAAASSATDGWDISVWDTSLWDATAAGTGADKSQWVAIGRTGHAIAPELQLTFGATLLPVVELVGIDVTFSVGALVA